MELLPCPFCGSNEIYAFHHLRQCIKCIGCDSIFISDNGKNKWNTRHSPWISVKDRLPDSQEYEFLVVNSEGNMHVASYWGENASNDEGYDWFNGDVFVNPTHWQPLPEPPKETIK